MLVLHDVGWSLGGIEMVFVRTLLLLLSVTQRRNTNGDTLERGCLHSTSIAESFSTSDLMNSIETLAGTVRRTQTGV